MGRGGLRQGGWRPGRSVVKCQALGLAASVAANWAVPLIIGNDQNDIGRLGDGRGRKTAEEAEEAEESFH